MKHKILVVSSSYPKFKGDINGGFVHELSRRLINEFDVFVVSPWEKGLLKNEIMDGVCVYRHRQFIWNVKLAYGIGLFENFKKSPLNYIFLPFYFLFQLFAIIKICKLEKIRIIHTHWLIPNGLIAVIYKKIFNPKVKVLCTIHGSDYYGLNNFLGNFLKRFTLKKCAKITVVSEALKNDLLKNYSVKEVFVQPMGIDTNLFAPIKYNHFLKEKLNIQGPFLLFVGIIVESKGIKNLIDALTDVLFEFPNLKLVVVGEGEQKKEMIENVQKIGITDSVLFVGKLEQLELSKYYATADIFILPSKSEGFGLVYAEALSSGVFTIASDLPAVHDIIEDYQTGFFLKNIDSKTIAKKIIEVINNKEKFLFVKNNGRNHIVDNFDWEIIKYKYINLINKLVSN